MVFGSSVDGIPTAPIAITCRGYTEVSCAGPPFKDKEVPEAKLKSDYVALCIAVRCQQNNFLKFRTRVFNSDHVISRWLLSSATRNAKRGGFKFTDDLFQFLDRTAKFAALGKTGSALEVAKAVYFLASEESSFTTGDLLRVDGGRGIMHLR